MTEQQMQHAVRLIEAARSIERKIKTWVLVKAEDKVTFGSPSDFDQKRFSAEIVPLPEAARRAAFRMWRKETALRFNEVVRELNQMGASHSFEPIQFSSSDGEPIL